jgi:DnaJ-class molecular chaperone
MTISEAREIIKTPKFGDQRVLDAVAFIEAYNMRCLDCNGQGYYDCECCGSDVDCESCEGTGKRLE